MPPGTAFSAALCRGLIEADGGIRLLLGLPYGFPRLYAAASLKRNPQCEFHEFTRTFSAALCRGLIEAPLS